MKRIALLAPIALIAAIAYTGLAALIAVSAVAADAAPPRAPAARPRAALHGFICQRARDPAARAISIFADMRPLAGTKLLALRFDLRVKTSSGHPPSSIHGGDLGRFISPANRSLGQRPGDVWSVNKQVVDLAAPAVYRLRITFRWTGAHGRVLGQTTRLSPSCYQPERRPDLLVQSIGVKRIAGQPKDRYLAVIRNRGATAAAPFQVKFADGPVIELGTVPRLPAHASRAVQFDGPVCVASAPPTVTVDPDHRLDDLHPPDNSLTATCPAASAISPTSTRPRATAAAR